MDTVRLDEDEGDSTNSTYVNQPELVWSGLYQRASQDDLPDSGYLPFGWKRVLRGQGKDAKWLYTTDSTDSQPPSYHERPPSYEEAHTPPDIYSKNSLLNSKYIA
jgi:hypothetical protein